MNKRGILRIRLGHDANCSGYTYMPMILIGFLGYAALVIILVGIQAMLRIRGLAVRLHRYRMLFWVIPQVVVVVALLVWAFDSGAMDYVSGCVGALVIVMLLGLAVGCVLIRRSKARRPFVEDGDKRAVVP